MKDWFFWLHVTSSLYHTEGFCCLFLQCLSILDGDCSQALLCEVTALTAWIIGEEQGVLNYCKNKVFKMITCLFNFRTSFKYTVGVSPLLTRYYVGAYPRNLYLTSRSLKSWPKDFISFKLVTPRTTTTLLLVVKNLAPTVCQILKYVLILNVSLSRLL